MMIQKCECMVSVKCMFIELEQTLSTVQLQILSCKSDNLLIPIEKLHNLTSSPQRVHNQDSALPLLTSASLVFHISHDCSFLYSISTYEHKEQYASYSKFQGAL